MKHITVDWISPRDLSNYRPTRTRAFTMIILQVLAFLLVLVLLYDSRPVSQRQEKKIQTKQFKLHEATAHLKSIRYQQNLKNRSNEKAMEEEMLLSNSNRSKWIKTQMKQEMLDANIRRHTLAARLLRQHVLYAPEISDALNHRADRLQIGTQKYQQRKDKLKKNGRERKRYFHLNYHHEKDQDFKLIKDAEDCQRIIDENTKYLAKYDLKHSDNDLKRSTSKD